MFPYLFSVGSEANVKQCVLFVLGRPAVYLLFISIIRNETCTFRISYNIPGTQDCKDESGGGFAL